MLICAGFLIAWIPYAVVSVVSAFGSPDSVPIPVSVIPTLLAKSSAMYNPIIYQVVDLKNSCTKSSCFKALKERRHFRKTRYNVWDSFGLYFTCCHCPNRFPIICMCLFLLVVLVLVVSAKSLLLVGIVLVKESGCIYTESTLWRKQARCSRVWGPMWLIKQDALSDIESYSSLSCLGVRLSRHVIGSCSVRRTVAINKLIQAQVQVPESVAKVSHWMHLWPSQMYHRGKCWVFVPASDLVWMQPY